MWDYPRPPRLEPSDERVEIELGGVVICTTIRSLRVLETSHPPTYYLPMADFVEGALRPADGGSFCEWKGEASYVDVLGGDRVVERAGWYYPSPTPSFTRLVEHVAVYPAAMNACRVDGEMVQPQAGGFYGGWVTSRVVGPFKGEPGTWGW